MVHDLNLLIYHIYEKRILQLVAYMYVIVEEFVWVIIIMFRKQALVNVFILGDGQIYSFFFQKDRCIKYAQLKIIKLELWLLVVLIDSKQWLITKKLTC